MTTDEQRELVRLVNKLHTEMAEQLQANELRTSADRMKALDCIEALGHLSRIRFRFGGAMR